MCAWEDFLAVILSVLLDNKSVHHAASHCTAVLHNKSLYSCTPAIPCRARDKWLPAKELLGVIDLDRFCFFAFYSEIYVTEL